MSFRPAQRTGARRWTGLRRLGVAGWASAGVCLLLSVPLIAPQVLAPYDPTAIVPDAIYQAPSPAHWLGTDEYGRDILSRIIHGTRVSMSLGVVSVTLSVAVSLPLGIAAGWLCYLGYHAVHEEWKRCGARPAFVAALAGLAGAAVIQRGAEALFR